MRVNGVVAYKACATSAMREANNAPAIVETIFNETGVRIDVIDGQTEAKIIAATDLNDILDPKKHICMLMLEGEYRIFDIRRTQQNIK